MAGVLVMGLTVLIFFGIAYALDKIIPVRGRAKGTR
jgi:hypothetical protein